MTHPKPKSTGIAFIGCGFVADLYLQTLPAQRGLCLTGVYDRDPARLETFALHHGVHAYPDRAALLADPDVEIVVNLTNPASHAEVTRAALEAGKAVYSEKPLDTSLDGARALAEQARKAGLGLAAAPCNHLSEAVHALTAALRAQRIGRPLLAHAEMDDGMIPGLRYETWRSASGAPWPARDEFACGCVMEHAGYQIAPLVTLFGPVRRVTALAGLRLPDKTPGLSGEPQGPDLSFGVLEFDEGIMARLSCSILAPMNRSLRVVGEHGVLSVSDVWEYDSPVRLTRTGAAFGQRLRRKVEQRVLSRWAPGAMLGQRVTAIGRLGVGRLRGSGHRMDFGRGVAALAHALRSGAPMGPMRDLAVHVTEVTLALQDTPGRPQVRRITSDPRPLPPGP
ncbi:Gfo/Idh/MocA family protein [Roseospira visakhapatnamensis]|uniref:Putative dehydrogenase n=1 Tax=Roseospira visakhapatnamensis TaxID=390880 RepID=A0A7W6RCJ4_9PROT|nr:Gfo/Idh/MocA family oxidoreductase [Roseospira visakhapatnamensis]MBB4266005.1 putative dehydrogenase [Roseospira visakhapatnamensis]